jgi:hypothetical protein
VRQKPSKVNQIGDDRNQLGDIEWREVGLMASSASVCDPPHEQRRQRKRGDSLGLRWPAWRA